MTAPEGDGSIHYFVLGVCPWGTPEGSLLAPCGPVMNEFPAAEEM